MKTKHFILFILLGLLTIACKKEDIEYDYRDKYVGDWEFFIQENGFDMGADSSWTNAFTYIGTIEKTPFENEVDNETLNDKIDIHFGEYSKITFGVDKDGKLTGETPKQGGKFENENKIHFYVYYGGLGGGTTITVDGIKQ